MRDYYEITADVTGYSGEFGMLRATDRHGAKLVATSWP